MSAQPAGSRGPLAGAVLDYTAAIERLVPSARTAGDWAPLEEFVAVDGFQRVGTFLEVQDWRDYTEMLARWASSVERFETTVRRISELPGLVYFEIEERHHRGGTVHVVNSLTVFAFDGGGKICHLDVYLQQQSGSAR
jgi:hypothetical protein